MSSDMQRGGEYRAGCKGRFDTAGQSLASPCEYPISPASTLHGGQPDGAHIASAGRQLDPPAFDDFMDADGNPLDYASVSRGW